MVCGERIGDCGNNVYMHMYMHMHMCMYMYMCMCMHMHMFMLYVGCMLVFVLGDRGEIVATRPTPTSARTADAFINNSPPFFYRSHSRVRALGEADGRPGAPAVPAVVRATATVRPARPTTCSPARCTRDNHLYDASHPRTSRTSIDEVPAVTCLIRQEIPVSPPPSIICAAGVTPRPPAPLSVRCPPSPA